MVGSWTGRIYDSATAGVASATTATGSWSKNGDIVHLNINFGAVSIAGMTAATNAYIRGHGFKPVANTVLDISYSNIDVTTAYLQLVAEIDTDGNIFIREERDAAANGIVDVSQLSGATFRISGSFRVL